MDNFGRIALFENQFIPFVIQNLEIDMPGPGQTLVKIEACTICASDVHTFLGRREVSVPVILGHEIVGRIVSFGLGNHSVDFSGIPLTIGDRVTWSVVANCDSCFYCNQNMSQKCISNFKYGHLKFNYQHPWTGGLADYIMLVKGTKIFKIPSGLSLGASCPANCTTATNVAAFRTVGDIKGKTVLIMGAGMLGITACAIAKALGASLVIACDTIENRLLKAVEFGANTAVVPSDLPTVISRLTSGKGVDVMFEITGSPVAFENGFNHMGVGGRIVLVGSVFPSTPVPLFMETVVRKMLTIVGVHNYIPEDLAQAIVFLDQNKHLPWDKLVGAWFRLSEVDLAFQLAKSAQYFRVGVSDFPTE